MYQKIKELCENESISVYRLEKELGLSVGSVSKWEKSIPRADTLVKVANFFNKPIDFFIQESTNSITRRTRNEESND